MKNYEIDSRIHLSFLIMISKKFFLLLRKGVYILMNLWIIGKRFTKTPLPVKDEFYSNLNIENITDSDYKRAKKIL